MNTVKRCFFLGNIILLLLALNCLIYYDHRGHLWLKGVTSSWFVLIGAVNLIYAAIRKVKGWKFLALMELGLVLAATADVLLTVQFIVGVIVLALGHISCFAAFCNLKKFSYRDLYLALSIMAVSGLILVFTLSVHIYGNSMKILVGIYVVVISLMLGKALGNVRSKKSLSIVLMAAGAMLFWFSDLMLALNMFGNGGRLTSLLCLYTYWPGQYMIGFSVYFFVNEQLKISSGCK